MFLIQLLLSCLSLFEWFVFFKILFYFIFIYLFDLSFFILTLPPNQAKREKLRHHIASSFSGELKGIEYVGTFSQLLSPSPQLVEATSPPREEMFDADLLGSAYVFFFRFLFYLFYFLHYFPTIKLTSFFVTFQLSSHGRRRLLQ